MKSIAVFFGGESPEREISVITGALALNSLDKTKFVPVPVYVDETGKWFTGDALFNIDNYKNLDRKKLKSAALLPDGALYVIKGKKLKELCRPAAAINCMHGGAGENGSFSGLIEACGVPLASPSVLPSAVAMDKEATKIFLKGARVPCLPYAVFKSADCSAADLPFGFPVIVKPACGGSSIGINRANDIEELSAALLYALKFGGKALVEPFAEDFTEINCAAYRARNGEIIVSACEKPVKKDEILSFADKYEGGTHVFPADIEPKIAEKIQKTTASVYEKSGFSGIVRIDFMVINGKVFVNEINSVPGSLAYYLFCNTLKGFSSLLTELIAVAEDKSKTERLFVKRFDSGILSVAGAKGAKRG